MDCYVDFLTFLLIYTVGLTDKRYLGIVLSALMNAREQMTLTIGCRQIILHKNRFRFFSRAFPDFSRSPLPHSKRGILKKGQEKETKQLKSISEINQYRQGIFLLRYDINQTIIGVFLIIKISYHSHALPLCPKICVTRELIYRKK